MSGELTCSRDTGYLLLEFFDQGCQSFVRGHLAMLWFRVNGTEEKGSLCYSSLIVKRWKKGEVKDRMAWLVYLRALRTPPCTLQIGIPILQGLLGRGLASAAPMNDHKNDTLPKMRLIDHLRQCHRWEDVERHPKSEDSHNPCLRILSLILARPNTSCIYTTTTARLSSSLPHLLHLMSDTR